MALSGRDLLRAKLRRDREFPGITGETQPPPSRQEAPGGPVLPGVGMGWASGRTSISTAPLDPRMSTMSL